MSARVITVVVPATVVAGLAWSSGGYFPRTWGAVLLVEAVAIAAAALLSDRIERDPLALVVVGGLLVLAAWQLASRGWGIAPDASVLEAERTLVAAGAAGAAFLWVNRERADALVLAVLAGAGGASVGGLAQHAFSGGAPSERLEAPIGYTNAAGILAATTIVLGLGLVPVRPRLRTALVVAPVPPAAVALYLSLSRGSVLALALGLVLLAAALGTLERAVRLALTLLPAAAAVAFVAMTDAFSSHGVTAGEVAAALVLLALSAVSITLALLAAHLRVPEVRPVVRRSAFGVVTALVVALVVVAALGGIDARSAPAVQQGAPDRLLSSSTSSRGDYWDVAARMVVADPLVGAGAGSFERVWLRERPALLYVRDAHNLYLETLAELGPLGLAALLTALLAPLLAARRALGQVAGAPALAAYVALLAHAVIDWDWELPAVASCTILLGVALVRLGGAGTARAPGTALRAALLGAALVLAVVAVVAHAGNGALAEAHDALDEGDAVRARSQAERARRFTPWAMEPWGLLGEAELAAGDLRTARDRLRVATRDDPEGWSAWLALALVTTGAEREAAIAVVRRLNPLAPELDALAGDP